MAKYLPQGINNINNMYTGLDANKSLVPIIVSSYYFATDTGKIYRCYTNNTWTLVNIVLSGTESNLSNIVPIENDYYFTTDTFKRYFCFTAGTWTLLDSIHYEEYSNHLGTIDNFLTTDTGGNGTGSTDSTNHEYDMSTGITLIGYHTYRTKDQYTPAANKRVWGQFKVKNIVNGTKDALSIPTTWIGFASDLTTLGSAYVAAFFCDDIGGWGVTTVNNAGYNTTAITTPSSGDVLGISMTPEAVQFYKNGALLAQNTTEIPTQAMYLGASVVAEGAAMLAARTMSIDYIMMRQY